MKVGEDLAAPAPRPRDPGNRDIVAALDPGFHLSHLTGLPQTRPQPKYVAAIFPALPASPSGRADPGALALFQYFQNEALSQLHAGRAQERTDAAGRPALLADDLPQIGRRHAKLE